MALTVQGDYPCQGPTKLSAPDQPSWYHTIPLQSLLPECFSNVTVKVVAEYLNVPCLLCRVVRLQLHGVLLDGFVVSEEVDSVIVLAGCGVSLRIPRADLGGLVWRVDPDSNPHSLRQLGPSWLSAAVDNGRIPLVDTIELHTNGRVLAPLGSIHRRIRCFEPNETKRSIFKPPLFVYSKMYFPYLALKGVDKPAAPYLREQAAHQLLPNTKPLVAPLMHYCSFHEETGSYTIILDDLTNGTDYFHPKSSDEDIQNKKTGDVDSRTDTEVEKKLLRLAGSLAALHGRWLSTEGDHTNEQILRSKKVAELSKVMVHPLAFYAEWLQVIETCDEKKLPPQQRARVKKILARAYGQPFEPQAGAEERDADIAITANSLSLIHGHVCPAHVFLTDSGRTVPNCYLVDWKRSGVGPLEVDLVQCYAQFVSRKTRKQDPEILMRVLQEYILSLDIYYGCKRDLVSLIASMRDVANLMLIGGACDWNLHSELEMALSSVFQQLSDLSLPDQVTLMRERIAKGGY